MKLGVIGDYHVTSHRPIRRTDDYLATLLRKLEKALSIFKEQGCDHIIQVGDFFDTPTVSNHVEAEMIRILKKLPKPIYVIYGQHDISGHSATTLPNSPLAVLHSAGVVKLITSDPYSLSDENTHLYAASFGEEVPTPIHPSSYNILVTHRMIGDRPLYPGQILEGPKTFLRKNTDFNLVLCGDYHYRFVEINNDQVIVNPGAMVRKTISKYDLAHEPKVSVIETKTQAVEFFSLNAAPVEDVFDLSNKNVTLGDDTRIIDFIEKLREKEGTQVSWKQTLAAFLDKYNTSDSVRELIDVALEEVVSASS